MGEIMALINKSDLKYKYEWATIPGDDPKITGEPDSTRFSRNEGYEVLYLINKLSDLWNFENKKSALKIERMINEGLPSETQSQKKVKTWISVNWKKY